ncbi:hypothetical protein HLBENOHH_00419 [Aeromonas dhakensis]|uniref:DUF3732 domain-containing protein n=1 Tax=Aeromonas dhakensis TaxID=196024 RepID=UPI00366D6E61
MSRWNIAEIFFLGNQGKRRIISLKPGVNIITGASGTGKSTIIKAIDYCLGSSQCELPAHVRRRCTAVGVKWVSGESQMITGRIVPPMGQRTSTRMYVCSGRNLQLPNDIEDLNGQTNLQAGKAFIERVFGIGDIVDNDDDSFSQRGRATIRHATAYMFVTKDIIYNETALLHGLDQADEAKAIIDTMPYFLRVLNEQSVIDERRLRELRRLYDREERKQQKQTEDGGEFYRMAYDILRDAHRCRMINAIPNVSSVQEIREALKSIPKNDTDHLGSNKESPLPELYNKRKGLLADIELIRNKSRAVRNALREMSDFEGSMTRQYEKLNLATHIRHVENVCPVCESPSEHGRRITAALKESLNIISSESTAVEETKPYLIEHEQKLRNQLSELKKTVQMVDDSIRNWINKSEKNQKLESQGRYRAHLLGKISVLLDMNPSIKSSTIDMAVLREEIEALERKVDREARKVLLDRAHRKISEYASKGISELPTVTPCIDIEVEFYSRPPDIVVFEKGSNVVLRLSDLGSDQNYLAIHIALSFALQRYFKDAKAPVPGFLVFDQISRPYYPTHGEDETLFSTISEDEDVLAMRRHVDYLFKETEAQKDLQVLLIEHAYFADDPRYVKATRERWNRASGEALIPTDWPER